MTQPKMISLEKIGHIEEGFLSIWNENSENYFSVKRIFWNYATPKNITRGRHAHHKTEMILVAVGGEIIVDTICQSGQHIQFKLNDPNQGLYLPVLCWHTMKYSDHAIQLVLCSTKYDENDYIRSFSTFKKMQNQK